MAALNFSKFKGCIACHQDEEGNGGRSGPELYSGVPCQGMAEVHSGLGISTADFGDLANALVGSLTASSALVPHSRSIHASPLTSCTASPTRMVPCAGSRVIE